MRYLFRIILLIWITIIFSLIWLLYPIIRTLQFIWTFDIKSFTYKVDWKDLFFIYKDTSYTILANEYYTYISIKDFIIDKKTKVKLKIKEL